MCSFFVTNKIITDLDYVNYFQKFRGPDKTNYKTIKNINFVHNLLSITGSFIQQPFVDEHDDIVCIYNGQIYNYSSFGSYSSDGECLISLYEEYGITFPSFLDGEFAICLVDFKKNNLIISSDIFRTKPIFYSIEGDKFAVSSYQSCLERLGFETFHSVVANKTLVFSLDSLELVSAKSVYQFNIDQYKTDFDDWMIAFKNSIKKRTSNLREKVFIGLSSGYDSGCIAAELNRQNVSYKSYSLIGKENYLVLFRRLLRMNKNSKRKIVFDNREQYKDIILKDVEHVYYTINSSSSDYNEFDLLLQNDNGALGMACICSHAANENYKIILSGQGADEIFSDYGFRGKKFYKHSNFGGLFPDNLSEIFPWNSFYKSSMESYLLKDEYIGGLYGIEARYPFLDRFVVQEFLNLTAELKNLNYKSVLYEYLLANDYPFQKEVKLGF